MRKKFLVCLMLMVCVLMQAMPVMAAGVDINSIPVVKDGVMLISSRDIVLRDGVSTLIGTLGAEKRLTYIGDSSCKAVTFVPSEGIYYYGVMESVQDPDDPSETVSKYSMKSSSSFSDACSAASLLNNGDVFSTILSEEAVVVFVDGAGSPLYKCPVVDLSDHGINPLDTKSEGKPSLKITESQKLGSEDNVSGVELKLEYDLSSVNAGTASLLYVLETGMFVNIPDGVISGFTTFTMNEVSLEVYTIYLRTSTGSEYSVEYRPSFKSNSGFEPVSEELLGVPNVSVTGLPADDSVLDPPLRVTFVSDIPIQVVLNGDLVVGDAEFSLEVPCEIYENGNYSYVAITEYGNTVDGSFSVSCLTAGTDLAGLDLVASDGTLVQTGMDSGSNAWIICLVCIGVVLLVVSVVVFMKRNKGEEL